jgi:RHS repeat-associated protein
MASGAGAVEKASERVSPFAGSFNYGVPIEVPAFHGLEPALSLGYTSEGRNGFVGVGWGLSGFGSVDRVGAGLGSPRFDATDTYLVDGQEVLPCTVATQAPSCQAGATHTTKVESYRKIIFDAATNRWKVWSPSGVRAEYASIRDLGVNTLRWGLSSVTDTKGNTVNYTWACQFGECYPSTATFGPYVATIYRETRPDWTYTPQYDVMGALDRRLKSIFISLGTTPIRAYKLTYQQSAATGRSLLTSVTQYGKDVAQDGSGTITAGTALPPTTFSYQEDTLAKSFVSEAAAAPTPPTTVEPVTWTGGTGTQATENGNSLVKTATTGAWDAGAVSTRQISKTGYVEFTAQRDGGGKNTMIGLSHGDTDNTYQDIDFALHEVGDGTVKVWENGVPQGTFAVSDGDRLRIDATSPVVYRRNGNIFYTSSRTPTYPLLVDTSISSPGAVIHDVAISGWLTDASPWCPTGQLSTGDFNGDGRTDQLCYRRYASGGSRVEVKLGTATGFAPPTTWLTGWIFDRLTVGDFNGDGKSDLADYSDANFYVGLSSGTGFATLSLWGNATAVAGDGSQHSCRVDPAQTGTGDFNGDGITDVSCKLYGHPEIFIGLSNGTNGFTFSIFGQLACDVYELNGTLDFNGDGKDDWYCTGMTGPQAFNVFLSTGSSFSFPSYGNLNNSFCDWDGYVLGDLNGDGRTDAYCKWNGKVAWSTGSLFLVDTVSFATSCTTGTLFAADVDGDGASELVCNNTGAGNDDIQVRKWHGNADGSEALGPIETWRTDWCSGNVIPGDFNGDGRTDLLCPSLPTPVAVAGTAAFQADLLKTVTTSLGGQLEATYAPSTNYPNTNNPGPRNVVNSVTTRDGRGWSATTTYSFSGGMVDRRERMFLGFREVDETLPCLPGETTCPQVKTFLRQDLASKGSPERVERWIDGLEPIRKDEYQYLTSNTQGVLRSLVSGAWSYDRDPFCTSSPCSTKRTRRTSQYDQYGNVTQSTAYGDYDVSDDETTEVVDYRPNTAAWILRLPARQQTRAGIGSGGTLLSESLFHYDGSQSWDAQPTQGYLTQSRSWLDRENRYVSTYAAYDSWGNPTTATDPTNRSVTTTYDATYHLFPVSTINAAGEQSSSAWDYVCGVPGVVYDVNGQATTTSTDALCRPSRTDLPLGGFVERSYLSLGDPTQQRVRTETPAPTNALGISRLFGEQYMDGLGRTYRSATSGSLPGQIILQDATFNARGAVGAATAPYYQGDPAYWTTFSFDRLDRPVLTTYPDGRSTALGYGLWNQTAWDENGKAVSEVYDGRGRRTTTINYLGQTVVPTYYAYDLLGRMTAMADAAGNVWNWSIDSLGRTWRVADPDSGTSTSTFDDSGRPLVVTDAKGQRTEFSYDSVGRMNSKTVRTSGNALERTVAIAYGEQRSGYFNIGQATTIDDGTALTTSDYDARGRVVHFVRTIDGQAFSVQRRYDAAGALTGTTYPDGESIGTPGAPLLYDAAGRLKTVPGYLSSVSYNAAGAALVQVNPNDTTTTRSYSPQRGFLTGVQTISTSGTTIQNLAYGHDWAGRIQSVTSPFPKESWTYQYDDLYRLTQATNITHGAENQSFVYDSIGRITYNSRVGNYSYPAGGQPRPHAPTVAGGSAYTYDGNGNLVTGGGRSLTWNAENRPVSIGTASMVYDGAGERIKKVVSGSTTLYPMGDDYEVANGVVTKYLRAAGLGVFAKRVGGADAHTYWLHTDHLGSIQAMTDERGLEVLRRAYRPFGENLAETGSQPESLGYIGERVDESNLSYLHARYYDPALGGFLSPDPSAPTAPGVGKNRFLYALGDPINLRDTTGLEVPVACQHDGEPCTGQEEVTVLERATIILLSTFSHPEWSGDGGLVDRLDIGVIGPGRHIVGVFIPQIPAAATTGTTAASGGTSTPEDEKPKWWKKLAQKLKDLPTQVLDGFRSQLVEGVCSGYIDINGSTQFVPVTLGVFTGPSGGVQVARNGSVAYLGAAFGFSPGVQGSLSRSLAGSPSTGLSIAGGATLYQNGEWGVGPTGQVGLAPIGPHADPFVENGLAFGWGQGGTVTVTWGFAQPGTNFGSVCR